MAVNKNIEDKPHCILFTRFCFQNGLNCCLLIHILLAIFVFVLLL